MSDSLQLHGYSPSGSSVHGIFQARIQSGWPFPSPVQCRRLEFNPWVGKIPWRREWQPANNILVWRIPRTEEPGGLQSMGPQPGTTERLTHIPLFKTLLWLPFGPRINWPPCSTPAQPALVSGPLHFLFPPQIALLTTQPHPVQSTSFS